MFYSWGATLVFATLYSLFVRSRLHEFHEPVVLYLCLALTSPSYPRFLLSRLFFFSVRPFEGKPLHSSKAVGRAHDSTSNLEQGQPNVVDNVNWWTGSWESVVRTMRGRETMGKKQWAPISIYLDLWGFYRCCFFYFIFLCPFFPRFCICTLVLYCRNYVIKKICPNVSFTHHHHVSFFFRQFDAVIIFTKECEIYSRFFFFTINSHVR